MLNLQEQAIPIPWSGCWVWEGRATTNGYGYYRRQRVHRLVWEEANGPIPEGLYVCHHCDVKLCCNPQHLFLGTQRDNILDYFAKHRRVGRNQNYGRAYCIYGHAYTPENTGIQAAGKQRFCLECRRIRDRLRRPFRDKAQHAAQNRAYRRRKKESG